MTRRNNAVTALLKRPIAFHPVLARISGSVPAGLMLSQAVYWTGVVEEKLPCRGGWFYKTQAGWKDETCLSRWEQESARKLLRRCDFWHEGRRGTPARLWFRVDIEMLATAISEYEEKPHSRVRDYRAIDRGESTDKLAEKPRTIPETTESSSENLGRFAASSHQFSPSRKTPQQTRYAIISRLAYHATQVLKDQPKISHGDLAEILKTRAAQHGIPYFDAWPGAASPIQQAITIAMERSA